MRITAAAAAAAITVIAAINYVPFSSAIIVFALQYCYFCDHCYYRQE